MGVPSGPVMEMLKGFPIRDPYQRVAAVILYSRQGWCFSEVYDDK